MQCTHYTLVEASQGQNQWVSLDRQTPQTPEEVGRAGAEVAPVVETHPQSLLLPHQSDEPSHVKRSEGERRDEEKMKGLCLKLTNAFSLW